ncbi:inhibitor of nuclear factor kappa-B kinase subunit alpha-like [Saccostrea echinata]|uniref:inhibitor of nuclear factor kappa-B kinase subunit alpha-like n=1 Tax=Saccostrea echinata TaxID=191078 RepID=UPI002A835651|nr:inhibitor of nuclear factor kappa-B kinase subunit alpha-like [Saccostrea echinata]
MAFTQPSKRGDWVEEKILGSGGFGQVVLWKNEDSGEYVAIKKCRVQSEMTQKHRERWTLEVDIMKRLDHPNVIAAKDVPSVLNVSTGELPLLAMEYCPGGDLRKVLNKPEYCVGLKEFDIRCLVRDIASAIEYLHGKRIIHRDLKPENIVLQTQEEQTVYKLIDLGYAKELDQGSVCTSFVGTLQYLAPELFASQKYTCTVDYWSFGTVVFECITGFRPFLPQVPPVTWHREVCKKSPDDITAFYNSDGVVKFSKKIVTPTHLCRSMQAYFEQWLRLMLRWDPKARGGGLIEGRPQCFKILDTMLSIKIVHILYVANNQLLSYPLLDNYSMLELQENVEKETGVKVQDQDILLASGASPDPNLGAHQCWTAPGDEDWVVFMFIKGENQGGGEKKNKPLPPNVQSIVKDSKTALPYNEQKRAWAESVYFCGQQVVDFRRLIQSQRAAMLSLLRTNSSFLRMKNSMVGSCDHLLSKMQYFKECLQHDLDMYEIQKSDGVQNAEKVVAKWKRIGEEVDGLRNLKEKVAKLDQQSTALQTKIVELQKSPFARGKQNEVLEDIEKKAVTLYHDMRQAGKGGRDIFKDHSPMVQIVVKCLIHRDKSLQDLYTHLGKICACKHELFQLLPSIQQCCKQIIDATDKLLQSHKQRQSDIWSLIKMAAKNGMSRQDSKGSNCANSWGASSLESMKVCDDNRETVKKFDDIIKMVMEEHEEHMSSMDWSFLPPLQKNTS